MSAHPQLAATPWPAEDGGPRRQQRPHGIPGPRAGRAELAASRLAPLSIMAVLAPDDRVLLLRREIGDDGPTWVEEIDPDSLEPVRRSPDLPTGPFWPGGMAVLADGAIVVVQGAWAHRLAPDLSVVRARRLPVDAPHNSFVVLDDGSLATKDLQRPGGPPSTLSILDPVTLEDRAAPLVLPEPSVARLSADGSTIVVVGVTALHRLAWEPAAGTLAPAAPSVTYLDDEVHSFGWDPVVDAGAIWWMDGGDHTFAEGMTMLGNGVAPGANRLWRFPLDGAAPAWVEISGRPGGAVTNPPIVDPTRGLVVAYDSANGVAAAFDVDDLSPRWRTELRTAQHLVLFPDTGELIADDHDPATGDALVVVDVATGGVRTRCAVGSPAQSVVFGAPGTRRDHYFVSLSTVARVTFHDA
ncbi:hypothetical protein [Actinomarinicola tropica]|uniref:PQQ-binding-like beta-propeller repeat protein n=1 Tax=Actinomarinicola tropica TaxID=2789776 RepID=A0A5Q2RF64_9ACTN|nr:hypothetical protein [Actinomarinicola tropica]QGG94323.1 hypothetical protein GH723_03970 [Actinomarinicola tropica]